MEDQSQRRLFHLSQAKPFPAILQLCPEDIRKTMASLPIACMIRFLMNITILGKGAPQSWMEKGIMQSPSG